MDFGNISQIFSAVGTVSAVLLALFRDFFLAKFIRPDLKLSIELANPDCHKTRINYPGAESGDCYYFRFWVYNQGTVSASNVQVYAKELLCLNADGTEAGHHPRFLPMNFFWAYKSNVTGKRSVFSSNISKSMGRHCDFCHIVNGYSCGNGAQCDPNDNVLLLDLEFDGEVGNCILIPGRYRLTLLVAADNYSPVAYAVDFSYNGMWSHDESVMFNNCFRMIGCTLA